MGRLESRVALISGGARGMGAEEARVFAAEGARVVIGDVIEDVGRTTAKEIGEAAAFVRLDVTREEDWARAVAETTRRFGRLDVLVNNAGIVRVGAIEETTLEDYRAVIDVNQVGVFLGMRAAIPAMRAAGGGSIINISSIDGIVGMNNVVAYVASKFAVRGMTKVAALELSREGIRVNSIHPGYIATPMADPSGRGNASALAGYAEKRVPAGRIGTAREVANLALFLASDESSYCSGAEFVVDGALLAGERLSTDPR